MQDTLKELVDELGEAEVLRLAMRQRFVETRMNEVNRIRAEHPELSIREAWERMRSYDPK